MRIWIPFMIMCCVSILLTAFRAGDGSGLAYKAYLGCTTSGSVNLNKQAFDNLIAQPLCARDSNQLPVTIQSFEILYAERGLYQDSAGLPIIFTDYTRIPVEGNQLDKKWINEFVERSYKGDTVFIQNVKVAGADKKSHLAEGVRVVIQ